MAERKHASKFKPDPKRIKELEHARNKTGLWTKRNIQFKTVQTSGGNFKGVRKNYRRQNAFTRPPKRVFHKIRSKLKSAH